MKKKEVRQVLDALKVIKVTKIEDEKLRNTIISNHLALLGIKRKIDQDVDDARSAFLGPFAEDIKQIAILQREMSHEADPAKKLEIAGKIDSHKEYLEAYDAFCQAMDKMGEEEVSGYTPIDAERFCLEYRKQDYDFDIVERIYPLFE